MYNVPFEKGLIVLTLSSSCGVIIRRTKVTYARSISDEKGSIMLSKCT